MRVELVRETLEALDEDAAYELIAQALRLPPAGHTTANPLRAALHELLLGVGEDDALDYERRAHWYTRACEEQDDLVMGLLRTHSTTLELLAPESQLHVDLRDVPLGRRRSLARTPDPVLLEKLAKDPDPTVIRNLLDNPRTTEDDVLRLAAMRPVAATSLVAVAESARWNTRVRVRVALAHNPYCPTETVLGLLGGLPRQSLRELANAASVPEALRQGARGELERRSPR